MAKKSLSYDQAIAQIEEIMAKFRAGEMSVDQLASEVKRAKELIVYCKQRLLKAEDDLKEITQ